MLTPIVTSLAYCFPQSAVDFAANEDSKNQRRTSTTQGNDDDDDTLQASSYYDDFFEGYFTDAFDTVDHDTDGSSAIQSHSNTLTDDDQSLLCDIESLTSADEYSNRSTDSRLDDKDGFHFSAGETKTKSKSSLGGDTRTEVYERWISEACRQLNISKNPMLWNDREVRSWCEWALSQYQVRPTRRKMLLNNLHHNGISFSQLQEMDFTQLFHSAGVYLYAELELWKNATEISSTDLASAEIMAFSQTVDTSSNSPTNCLWSTSQTSGRQEPVNRIPTNTTSNGFTLTDCASSFRQESRTSFAVSDTSSVDVSHASITSVPLPSSSDCQSSWSRIPTFVLESVLCDDSFADSSASSGGGGGGKTALRSFLDAEEADRRLQGAAAAAMGGGGGGGGGGLRFGDTDSSSSSSHSHFAIFHRDSMKGDSVATRPVEWEEEEEGPYSSKHGHHLWQFLQELLRTPSVYEHCIRWTDRRKGIFKIEDSVKVARLWGQRKNRPAMNYDKLSRSIRQYYKKGIIQKTSDSRRLVYQFCPKYNI